MPDLTQTESFDDADAAVARIAEIYGQSTARLRDVGTAGTRAEVGALGLVGRLAGLQVSEILVQHSNQFGCRPV